MEDKTYFLPSKAYEWLKWAGLIALPALATFIGVLGTVWNWPNVDAIVATVNAVGVLIGALIGASHVTATTDATKTK